jgi:fused signal recognition particle receptor
MSEIFSKWRESLDRTRKATFGRIVSVFGGSEVTQETWDDLEALLIQADVGVETSQLISERLRKAVQEQGIITTADFQQALSNILRELLLPPVELDIESHQPAVILLVG